MKILIGHNYYQDAGGEDAVVRSEAALLKDHGEEVVLYERHNEELNRLNSLEKAMHFFSLGHSAKSFEDMQALIRRVRPSVAHFHNIFYMMTPSVYEACRREGVAIVQSLHNFRLMCANGLFFRDGHVCEDCLTKSRWEGIKHRCLRDSAVVTAAVTSAVGGHWRKGTWLNTVDRYIVASEFTRRKYVQAGIPSEKIAVKPNFLYPDPGMQRNNGGYILYVGRLSSEKGVEVLLEAWRSLKDVKLKIAGSGPLEAKLKAYAADNGLTHVEFMGFVDQRVYDASMRGASAVVVPSKCYENFPRIVAEAFAYGVPVIASRLGSLTELAQDGKTGLLFEAGNATELSQKVRWMIANPDAVKVMGENARRVFEEQYSAEANYKNLMRIYEQAVGAMK